MLDNDVKIIRQVQDARLDLTGTSTPIVRIDFMVGTHGPFSEKLTKDDFVAGKRDDVLNAFAAIVRVP